MSGVFKFKQFDVDQTGCAMKINTDGVLLGALADADDPKTILDIGTGTGVIALMLAQRFKDAQVDAVEIDEQAAETAARNFKTSLFADRLELYSRSFECFFDSNPKKKYDLIVSNPPFYINSLESPRKNKKVAKHADKEFFERLINGSLHHFTPKGVLCLILPNDTAKLVREIAIVNGLFLNGQTAILSYDYSEPHRQILFLSSIERQIRTNRLAIYKTPKVYSEEYQATLKDFFTIF
ncbi:MAG TPA: methyltransferase [Mucilaginibacter sp.]|nr:methyltransferase [Mucilaginibacter sp.]